MTAYGIVLFHTSSAAMQAEAVLTRASVPATLVPTPRQLSSDCGVSLRFDWSQNDRVCEMLSRARVETAGIHPLPGKE
jgi:hypothetical protein